MHKKLLLAATAAAAVVAMTACSEVPTPTEIKKAEVETKQEAAKPAGPVDAQGPIGATESHFDRQRLHTHEGRHAARLFIRRYHQEAGCWLRNQTKSAVGGITGPLESPRLDRRLGPVCWRSPTD